MSILEKIKKTILNFFSYEEEWLLPYPYEESPKWTYLEGKIESKKSRFQKFQKLPKGAYGRC